MTPAMTRRAAARASRELRVGAARLRHRRVTFGHNCDIRAGLHLYIAPGAEVRFGERCVVDRRMTIECHGELIVGAHTIFGHSCTLGIREAVTIGADCLIAEMVSIRDHDHRSADLSLPIRLQGADVAPVTIGKNVWIGSKATILKGVTIGDDAIVGAGAVVTRNVSAQTIVAGVPAKVVRYRNDLRR